MFAEGVGDERCSGGDPHGRRSSRTKFGGDTGASVDGLGEEGFGGMAHRRDISLWRNSRKTDAFGGQTPAEFLFVWRRAGSGLCACRDGGTAAYRRGVAYRSLTVAARFGLAGLWSSGEGVGRERSRSSGNVIPRRASGWWCAPHPVRF